MAKATINWDSLIKKVGRVASRKATRVAELNAEVIANKFIELMNDAIIQCAGPTQPEIQRILEHPLECTGSSVTGVHTNMDLEVSYGIELYFDFSGDKTMVSLSPKKYVHDLVALFNNGYDTNNIDPKRPITGIWHGHKLTLGPYSMQGGHFIGRAIQQFELWAASQDIVVKAQVNPIYNDSTN